MNNETISTTISIVAKSPATIDMRNTRAQLSQRQGNN